jgi:hypothetical protein
MAVTFGTLPPMGIIMPDMGMTDAVSVGAGLSAWTASKDRPEDQPDVAGNQPENSLRSG